MTNPVIHWEIGGKDGKKMNEFYSNLFNWDIQHAPEMNYYSCMTGEGEVAGGFFQIDESKGMKPFVTIYVQVDDLQVTLDKVESLGGKTIVPPMVISEQIGSCALFTDPDGNLVGIFKNPE